MRVVVTYEYSNGKCGIKEFDDVTLAYRWINGEGDHLVDYNIFFA